MHFFSKKQNANVVLVMDPMEPFEKAAVQRRNRNWYDIENDTISYKI